MNYWTYLENPWVAAILSFLIGFGIAAIFRPICHGSECIVVHGPPVHDVINKVYQMGEKCVEFTTEVVTCPTPKPGEEQPEVVKTVMMVSG